MPNTRYNADVINREHAMNSIEPASDPTRVAVPTVQAIQNDHRLKVDESLRIDHGIRRDDRLLRELVNDLACRLTMISSLLGACELSMPPESADDADLSRVHAALRAANATVGDASQVACSVKTLVRSFEGGSEWQSPLTISAVLGQAAQIIEPKLRSAAVNLQIDVQATGAVVSAPARFVLAFVSLIDATIEEFSFADATRRQIKIRAETHAGNLEIFMTGLASVESRSRPQTEFKLPSQSDTSQRSATLEAQRQNLARRIGKEIQGHLILTQTARNEPGYRMLIPLGSSANRQSPLPHA